MYEQRFALGMIETIGFPALVAAADAAAKAADVHINSYQGVDAGIVTVYIIGDVASVQAAVQAGEAEARRVGQLRHSHVIARPDSSVPRMILEQYERKLTEQESKKKAQEAVSKTIPATPAIPPHPTQESGEMGKAEAAGQQPGSGIQRKKGEE